MITKDGNISVWRGESTPPTIYHQWIKEDADGNQLGVYFNVHGEWVEHPSYNLLLDFTEYGITDTVLGIPTQEMLDSYITDHPDKIQQLWDKVLERDANISFKCYDDQDFIVYWHSVGAINEGDLSIGINFQKGEDVVYLWLSDHNNPRFQILHYLLATQQDLNTVKTDLEDLKSKAVLFDENDNVPLREGTKILGKKSDGTEHELIGLAEYSEISVNKLPIGYNLRGKTITFTHQDLTPIGLINSSEYLTCDSSKGLSADVMEYDDGISSANILIRIEYEPTPGQLVYDIHETIYNTVQGGWLINEFTFPNDIDIIIDNNTLPVSTDSSIWGFNYALIDVAIQTEVGSEHTHLNLNTNNDPTYETAITVDTPDGKETLVYNSKLTEELNKKQNILTSGRLIEIENDKISTTAVEDVTVSKNITQTNVNSGYLQWSSKDTDGNIWFAYSSKGALTLPVGSTEFISINTPDNYSVIYIGEINNVKYFASGNRVYSYNGITFTNILNATSGTDTAKIQKGVDGSYYIIADNIYKLNVSTNTFDMFKSGKYDNIGNSKNYTYVGIGGAGGASGLYVINHLTGTVTLTSPRIYNPIAIVDNPESSSITYLIASAGLYRITSSGTTDTITLIRSLNINVWKRPLMINNILYFTTSDSVYLFNILTEELIRIPFAFGSGNTYFIEFNKKAFFAWSNALWHVDESNLSVVKELDLNPPAIGTTLIVGWDNNLYYGDTYNQGIQKINMPASQYIREEGKWVPYIGYDDSELRQLIENISQDIQTIEVEVDGGEY